ncbi:MAG: hypothetical protein Q9165_005530 [Trypethelium subeluteriae]
MDEESQTLSALYTDAEKRRAEIEAVIDSNTTAFQQNLSSAIAVPNETLEDVSSKDIEYFLINYRRAELHLKSQRQDRATILREALAAYEAFVQLLDQYDILSRDNARLFSHWKESPERFSTAATTDAARRRETKIARFKQEKELKRKLEYLQRNPEALHNDDAALRQLYLLEIEFATHQTFQSLESIIQELQILRLAPPEQVPDSVARSNDSRERNGVSGPSNSYSERLDHPISQLSANGNAGPILDRSGRPLRPFTILDNRQRLRDGVFRPDHSLPTMTIDEYLEEEKRRGGIIEGGGPQSGIRPEPDEDDMDKADEETMKARAWDNFKEDNPKGSGNTLNRG